MSCLTQPCTYMCLAAANVCHQSQGVRLWPDQDGPALCRVLAPVLLPPAGLGRSLEAHASWVVQGLGFASAHHTCRDFVCAATTRPEASKTLTVCSPEGNLLMLARSWSCCLLPSGIPPACSHGECWTRNTRGAANRHTHTMLCVRLCCQTGSSHQVRTAFKVCKAARE